MVSKYFYLPANEKHTDEERIAYTQAKIAFVKEWLTHDFVRTKFGTYYKADMSGTIEKIKLVVSPNRIVIGYNWWNECCDWFFEKYNCKIDKTDLLYLLMQLYHEAGFNVKPVDCSLCIEL